MILQNSTVKELREEVYETRVNQDGRHQYSNQQLKLKKGSGTSLRPTTFAPHRTANLIPEKMLPCDTRVGGERTLAL